MIRLGITGTDTGVGKTVVACALARAFYGKGRHVRVMKPVETGVQPDDVQSDAARLLQASRAGDSLGSIRPYVFPDPLAPMIAARNADTVIRLELLDAAFREITKSGELAIVEGAGGLRVPIAPGLTFVELFARWRLGLVVVAENRLGVINHVLLTMDSARRTGITVHAVVVNDTASTPHDASVAVNVQVLQELLPDLSVVRYPWLASPDDFDEAAAAADASGLTTVLNVLTDL